MRYRSCLKKLLLVFEAPAGTQATMIRDKNSNYWELGLQHVTSLMAPRVFPVVTRLTVCRLPKVLTLCISANIWLVEGPFGFITDTIKTNKNNVRCPWLGFVGHVGGVVHDVWNWKLLIVGFGGGAYQSQSSLDGGTRRISICRAQLTS